MNINFTNNNSNVLGFKYREYEQIMTEAHKEKVVKDA